MSDPTTIPAAERILFRLAGTFTLEPLEEHLRFWLTKLGWPHAEVSFAGYNQIFQELLNPSNSAQGEEPGVNFFVLRISDFLRHTVGEVSRNPLERLDIVRRNVLELTEAFKAFVKRARRNSIVLLCSSPQDDEALQLAGENLIRSLKELPGITILAESQISQWYPADKKYDPESDTQGHVPYTAEYFAAIAAGLMRMAWTSLSPPLKALIVDADNTLWKGVVGELGPEGVQITPAHALLHTRLLKLKEAGVLLAIASKNSIDDVLAVLSRQDIALQSADFAAFKISWQAKSQSIHELSEEWNLAEDSFAFLDDNPVECAEVASACPNVTVIQVPDPELLKPNFIEHLWVLDMQQTTAPELNRTEMMRQQAARLEEAGSAASFREFIEGLELKLDFRTPAASDFPRIAQLTQRTNQFNATGIRRTEAEVASVLSEGSRLCLLLHASDRFGDYGDVGVVIYHVRGPLLMVENFLLSCRVLGKGVEHRLLSEVGTLAAQNRCVGIVLPFKATERNQPVASFLLEVGQDCLKNDAFHFPTHRALAVNFDPDKVSSRNSGGTGGAIGTRRTQIDFAGIAHDCASASKLNEAVATTQHRTRPKLAEPAIAPETMLQRRLASIWSEILRIDIIGIRDDFTELGGQSLTAMRIVSKIAAEFHVRLPLTSLFHHSTVEKLAARVEAAGREDFSTDASTLLQETSEVSPPKQRLWFLDQLIPHRAAYHIPTAMKLVGKLDGSVLEKALKLVCQRHSILQAEFPSVDGKPVQRLSSIPHFNLAQTSAGSEEAAMQLARRDAVQPFALETAPLFRCTLISIGNDRQLHLLTCVFHHIISDGLSVNQFYRDLTTACTAVLNNSQPSWEALFATCSGYSAWINQRVRQGAFASDTEYWKRQLSGAPAVLQLPTDRPHPPVRSYEGGIAYAALPASSRSNVEALAARFHTTPYAVLAAVFQVLLHRLSGREDILIGVPVAGRSHSAVENVLGCFVNTVVLRARCESGQNFSDFLKATRATLLEALEHQDVPFESLVDALEISRDLSHTPIFQHIFVMQDSGGGALAMPGINCSAVPIHNGGAKVDLVLEVTPNTLGDYSLSLEYNSAVFDSGTASRWLGHFCNLVQAVCEAPETKLQQLPLLTEQELSSIVFGFNGTDKTFSGGICLHHWFERISAQTPDAVAVTCEANSLTYGQLNARANRLAHALLKKGAGPDVLIGLCVDRNLNLVVALLAILKSGAAYLPIDLSYPAERLAFMLEDSNAPILLTETGLLERLPNHAAELVCVDSEELFSEESAENPSTAACPDHLAYVIFTSGSTGRPKGCMVTHRNATRLMLATEDWYHFNSRDVWTLFHSTAFDFSVWEFWGALLYGGRLVVVPYHVSRSPEEFYQLLSTEKVTVLNQTPSAFRQLIATEEAAAAPLPLQLRLVIFGGEALEMQSLRPWFQRHGDQMPQLVNMYGITETTVHVTYRPISANDLQGGSVIGIPIPDLQVYIVDANLQPVPIGVPGEMLVGGAGLARGYLNRPGLTAERFILDHLSGRVKERLYRTGDLARLLPGRDIEYLGRIDQQVKIRGFRIELGEIESVLASHPLVKEAAVIPREDTPGNRRLVAYLVTSELRPSLAELREHLHVKLPEYMIPAAFVLMDKFPITGNGKLDRAALPAPDHELSAAGRDFVEARNEAESRLATVWAKVLKVDRVGVNDNFFELGGDSILSIHMIAQARKVGLNFTPRQLFEHQTVAGLAALPQAISKSAEASQLAVSTTEIPLLPIQNWFFEQKLDDSHFWNQTFLFTVSERLDADLLKSAVDQVARHHEALRLRFSQQAGSWQQSLSDELISDLVEIYPLDGFANGKLAAKILEVSKDIQSRLSYERGPLFRVAYLDLGEDRPGRLLVAAHHLAIDGVSWGILLGDLESAYRGNTLLPIPAPFSLAAAQAESWAKSDAAKSEAPWWQSQKNPSIEPFLSLDFEDGPNTEESADTIRLELSTDETKALLQQVPAAFRSRINDVLLASLLLAAQRKLRRSEINIHLEGHGREDVYGSLDLSRTIGWFTALFPVRLQFPESALASDVVQSTKEQLRKIPQNGAGFGFIPTEKSTADSDLVFNYLGRLDQLTEASELFENAAESTGPWHSPQALRKHLHEIDCSIIQDQFRLEWKYSRNRHRTESVRLIADAFMTALREIIHLAKSGSRAKFTPQDFPLLALTQQEIQLLASGSTSAADILPLSPIQELFYGASAAKINAGYDQWSSRLVGELEVERFKNAWNQVLQRHAILRTSFHSAGLSKPVQVVHETLAPLWNHIDLRHFSVEQKREKWNELLKEDAGIKNDLAKAPLTRFTLAQMTDTEWRFLWSVPELLLDGWSWPIVFGEVASIMNVKTGSLAEPATYRSFLEWLSRQDPSAEEKFWRGELEGFSSPTPVPVLCALASCKKGAHVETGIRLESEFVERLTRFCRNHQTTTGALIHAAWILLLARASDRKDILCGTASNGRPDDLAGVETIVGPFINNLPLRLTVQPAQRVAEFIQEVRSKLVNLTAHQHSSISQMQDWSAVPWRQRLFDSLVVFQNFSVDESMRQLGTGARMEDFQGPLHTSYALTLVVSPGACYDVVLAHAEAACPVPHAQLILADWRRLLEALVSNEDASVAQALTVCQLHAGSESVVLQPERAPGGPVPRTPLEKSIAAIWQRAFGIEDITLHDNFFDLGGQSLLMIRVHKRLREELGVNLSIVQLFQHPTVASLAAALEAAQQPAKPEAAITPGGAQGPQSIAIQARNRAAAARAAMARARGQSP